MGLASRRMSASRPLYPTPFSQLQHFSTPRLTQALYSLAERMRFRISTFLLVVAILAILLGWYLDRNRVENELVGTWHFPTLDNEQSAANRDTLILRDDGTFSKIQKYQFFGETYKGTYSIIQDGVVSFYVDEKDYELYGKTVETIHMGWNCHCRCAVDRDKYLLVHQVHCDRIGNEASSSRERFHLDWHCYSSLTPKEQGAIQKREFEKFMKYARQQEGK